VANVSMSRTRTRNRVGFLERRLNMRKLWMMIEGILGMGLALAGPAPAAQAAIKQINGAAPTP